MTMPEPMPSPTPKTLHETTLDAPPGVPTLTLTRWFDAPRALVWEAVTTPALVQQWWAPDWVEMVACEMDLRVGGSWRFRLRAPQGEIGFHGEYREIVAPERLVQTFIFDPIPDSPAIERLTLIADGDRTQLVVVAEHLSVEARDAHIASGMERGMRQTHAKLERLVMSLVR